MHQTQRPGRSRLRVLRTGIVSRLYPGASRAPHGELERLRVSTYTRGSGDTNDSPAQRAKRAGQCVLLLRERRTFGRGSGSRLVHVADRNGTLRQC